ncbi:alkaline shock response membrane anchor protein AmaP [Streptomyces bambusae]|uniref:alkaline shock response membrane anchor protein AmaP n=1 Tax=Streptomyces bambusae TaxID=1550616 RepID=UPI001CFEA60C|nr:alkaline shock response membrane anchor protein AmaP [Streptomyces bambusae]MCB5168121.1 alkaline shock response membrane anchor protein AmaP [Streptomyces bambusae]
MLAAANRILLALVGLALGGAGVLLLTGTGPYDGRHDVVLGEAERQRWHGHGWWWPAVLAALAVLVLLALWWLLAQLRRNRLPAVLVDTGDGAWALLRGHALETALTAETDALDGVEHCRATLHGRRETPSARLRVRLAPHAVPADVLAALADEILPHARTSAGLPAFPAEARLDVTGHHARRVT